MRKKVGVVTAETHENYEQLLKKIVSNKNAFFVKISFFIGYKGIIGDFFVS
tara:strand:+ start:250 stop:402 length:153 start_codon:yes stop_codon:yes gene_type:complete